jgi:hypothetical protein
MTASEMHIDFGLKYDQVASAKTLKFEREEIDWLLTTAQNRFIQARLKPKVDERTGKTTGGFEIDQLDADAIRTIIVSSYDLVPYIDQDGRRYRCFLPPDYSYLLSDWSYTTLLCPDDPPPTVIKETMYITGLRLEKSQAPSPPYYGNLQISLGGQLVSVPGDLPYFNSYAGYVELQDIAFLRPWLAKQGKWYWEKFDSFNWPYFFLSTTTNNQLNLPPYITIDGFTTTVTKLQSYPVTRHAGTGKYYDNRLSATDNISGMNSTEFVKSAHYSPISELSNGILYVYNDNSFIVSSVGISYVRKAQPISVILDTQCELPEEFHPNIVDLAVELAKGSVGNIPGYQTKVADNDKRVVL